MKRIGLVAVIAVLVVAGAMIALRSKEDAAPQTERVQNQGPQVVLRADDGTNISVRPYLVKGAKQGVVIIHNEGKDRGETMQFAEELAKLGKVSTIAIDLRGHGQSAGERDFTKMYMDAMAGEKYLKLQGARDISYIGFGSGAHIALNAAAKTEAKSVVMVSPQPNDKGLGTNDTIVGYHGRLLIASAQDDNKTNSIATKLFGLSKTKDKQYAEYKAGGYGIELVYNTDLGKLIRDWLVVR